MAGTPRNTLQKNEEEKIETTGYSIKKASHSEMIVELRK